LLRPAKSLQLFPVGLGFNGGDLWEVNTVKMAEEKMIILRMILISLTADSSYFAAVLGEKVKSLVKILSIMSQIHLSELLN
jgi:hypothetical protein